MMDWFIGVIVSVVIFCMVVLGFAMGKGSAASDCRDFGAFKVGDQRYVCSVDERAK